MFNLNKIIALTTVSLFMTACTITTGSTPRPYQSSSWYKEDVNKSDTNDRLGYCKTEVGASKLSQEEAKKLVGYCMKAHGYRLITETKYR